MKFGCKHVCASALNKQVLLNLLWKGDLNADTPIDGPFDAGPRRRDESPFYFLPPYVPPGGVGAVVCPRKALRAQRGAHPLTTIEPALHFKGPSLRNTKQRSWDEHRGSSHSGEGLLVECGVRKLCFRSQVQPAP